MKLFLTIVLCLCTLSSYAQTNKPPETCGNYSFGKATVSVLNFDTKEEVFSRVFAEPDALEGLNELAFLSTPVFASVGIGWNAHFKRNYLSMCELWNNDKRYEVTEDGEFTLMEPKDINQVESDKEDHFPLPYSIHPAEYEMDIQGDAVTFTFRFFYGDSRYSFPLEGKLVVVMLKDNTL